MSVAGKPGYKETAVGWIPVEWDVRSLEELSNDNITYGVVQPGPEVADGIPLVRGGDVKDGRISSTLRTISRDVSNQFARTVLRGGELLVSLVGYPGETAIAGAELEGANIARQVGLVRLNDNALPNFVQQYLASPSGKKVLLGGMIGSAQQVVNLSALREVDVPIPSQAEQQKIAAILTAVDDKLDLIARQISATQTLKQGLMQTLFTRGAGTPDAQGRWHPHTKFQDTELGRIPAEWRVQSVGDVCEVKGGKRLPKGESLTEENTGFPYIRVTDMHMGGVNANGVLYVPAHLQPLIKRYIISKDDIFISVAGTLGLVGTIPPELDGANLTENADKLTNITISRDYLLYCLCSPSIQDAISKEATANAQPKLALERIRGFKIPTPAQAEQQKIADVFKSVDDKLSALTTQQTHYQSLKRGLMQKLLTGEWRVPMN